MFFFFYSFILHIFTVFCSTMNSVRTVQMVEHLFSGTYFQIAPLIGCSVCIMIPILGIWTFDGYRLGKAEELTQNLTQVRVGAEFQKQNTVCESVFFGIFCTLSYLQHSVKDQMGISLVISTKVSIVPF